MNRTRLKYYLRALGIGIIVTALLMGYSQRGQAQMTDEEILRRAAELEKTEQRGVLAELATATPKPDEPLQSAAPTASPTATPTASPTADPAASPTAAPTASPTETPTASPTAAPTASPTTAPTAQPTVDTTSAPAGETVTLVINRGDSSATVSKNLQALGLVEDYKVYDRFLCDNKYDHSISTGTYEIQVDATDEEIARIITKKQ